MLKKLLPVMLSVVAFLGGAAGGEMLKRGAPEGAAADAPADAAAGGHGEASAFAGTGQGAEEAQAVSSTLPHDAPQDDGASSPHGTAAGGTAGHGAADGNGSPAGHGGEATGTAWFKFPQQFFVPILYDGRLDSTMILTLSVEMPAAARETVHAHEIKLRDALLRQLLIHANTGGFDGNFTTEAQLRKLRDSLTATAQGVVPEIAGILIGDIARQDR